MGRTKKDKEQKLSKVVVVRLTEGELKQLESSVNVQPACCRPDQEAAFLRQQPKSRDTEDHCSAIR